MYLGFKPIIRTVNECSSFQDHWRGERCEDEGCRNPNDFQLKKEVTKPLRIPLPFFEFPN